MAIIPVAKLGVTLKIDDKEYVVNEGDIITDLVYREGKEDKTLTGAVRVICASTKAQNTGPQDCPPEPYVHKYITPTMLVMDSSDENHAILDRINISNILAIGGVTPADTDEDAIVVGPGAQFKSLDQVLAEAEDGAVINLQAGEYSVPLNITKSVTITSDGNAVLTGPINLNAVPTAAEGDELVAQANTEKESVRVEISNVRLTGDAFITGGEGVNEFILSGCVIGGFDPTEKKSKPIKLQGQDTAEPMLVTIVGNTFEACGTNSYNMIELYPLLKDGSCVSGNDFLEGCCTHNQISIYNIEDNATVMIENNYAYRSANMVRLGLIGSAKGTIVMDGNKYDTTDENPKYAGLFLCEPYSTKTISWNDVRIDVNNTEHDDEQQVGYIYAGKTSTPFSETNKPTIYVDGVKVEIPDVSVPRTV